MNLLNVVMERVIMKSKMKIRQQILFTKARAHKMKNKVLDRKIKHKQKISCAY